MACASHAGQSIAVSRLPLKAAATAAVYPAMTSVCRRRNDVGKPRLTADERLVCQHGFTSRVLVSIYTQAYNSVRFVAILYEKNWLKFYWHQYYYMQFSNSIIIRPHRSSVYVGAAYCYRRSSVSVCWSITIVSPAKTAEPIEMPFGL